MIAMPPFPTVSIFRMTPTRLWTWLMKCTKLKIEERSLAEEEHSMKKPMSIRSMNVTGNLTRRWEDITTITQRNSVKILKEGLRCKALQTVTCP